MDEQPPNPPEVTEPDEIGEFVQRLLRTPPADLAEGLVTKQR